MPVIAIFVVSLLAVLWAAREYAHGRARDNAKAEQFRQQAIITYLNAEIATLKRTKEEFRAAKEGAEQANHSKTQFLANMSHELRTPLNAIIGFADIMSKELIGPVGTPAYKQYAADILAGGTHLFEILSDILDMARIDAGKAKLSESEFLVEDAITTALRMCEASARSAGKSIAFANSGSSTLVRADERVVRQIVINLVSNAIKYTRDDGRVVVTIETPDNGGVDVVVTDNGIGIASAKFELIMQRFGQVDDAFVRAKGGIGLGLPLVKSLVELHGGAFAIDSEEGRGTIARFQLPAERVLKRSESRLGLRSSFGV